MISIVLLTLFNSLKHGYRKISSKSFVLQGAYLKMRKVVKSILLLQFFEFNAENWPTYTSECCLQTLFQKNYKKLLSKDAVGLAAKDGGFAIRASNKKHNYSY